MISVKEAFSLVCRYAQPLEPVTRPLSETRGLVLAEQVVSGVDSPPYDKALLDGYAVVAADLQSGGAELVVQELVTAGQVPTQPVIRGAATRIMTGAPIPEGADAVVKVEDTRLESSSDGRPRVGIKKVKIRPGAGILPRGASMRRGDVAVDAGRPLRPVEIGLLAELGAVTVPVYPQPSVAVLATGNELVPAASEPAFGQIRNSNGPMLAALVQRAGAKAVDLGIGPDDEIQLGERIRPGFDRDVVIFSGGVSAGVLDLGPQVLEGLGVKRVFHKVKLKPGKPLWFGVLPAGSGHKLVFGLPGNPVSTLVCFELFLRPALARLAGLAKAAPRVRKARLACDLHHDSDRPTYHPGRLCDEEGRRVEPLKWRGSSDLRALTDADCLILLPAGDHRFDAGDKVPIQEL